MTQTPTKNSTFYLQCIQNVLLPPVEINERITMASTNDITMTIRTNSEIKQTAAALFDDLGLDMSTAVNMFLRECIRKDGIPFEVSRKEVPNRKTRRAIKNAINNKNMVGPFDTYEELMESLNA